MVPKFSFCETSPTLWRAPIDNEGSPDHDGELRRSLHSRWLEAGLDRPTLLTDDVTRSKNDGGCVGNWGNPAF